MQPAPHKNGGNLLFPRRAEDSPERAGNAGGVVQTLGNWEYRDDESGLDRVKAWVESSAEALDAYGKSRGLVIRLQRTDIFDAMHEL